MAGAETLPLPVGGGRAVGVGLALASMSTIQLGVALSDPLFDRIGPSGVVALRLALGALLLWPLARPRLRGRTRADLGIALAGSRRARDVAWVALAGAGVTILTLGDGAGGPLDATGVVFAGLGLALLVPLLPYAFELIALRRLPTALFGVIMSLEPAIAALLGLLILGQHLAAAGVVAIAMVSIASAGATLGAREPSEPADAAGAHAVT